MLDVAWYPLNPFVWCSVSSQMEGLCVVAACVEGFPPSRRGLGSGCAWVFFDHFLAAIALWYHTAWRSCVR